MHIFNAFSPKKQHNDGNITSAVQFYLVLTDQAAGKNNTNDGWMSCTQAGTFLKSLDFNSHIHFWKEHLESRGTTKWSNPICYCTTSESHYHPVASH